MRLPNSERKDHVAYYFESGLFPAEYREALVKQIITHGLAANRATLEIAAKFSNQQGLTKRLMPMEELFAANVLDT